MHDRTKRAPNLTITFRTWCQQSLRHGPKWNFLLSGLILCRCDRGAFGLFKSLVIEFYVSFSHLRVVIGT